MIWATEQLSRSVDELSTRRFAYAPGKSDLDVISIFRVIARTRARFAWRPTEPWLDAFTATGSQSILDILFYICNLKLYQL